MAFSMGATLPRASDSASDCARAAVAPGSAGGKGSVGGCGLAGLAGGQAVLDSVQAFLYADGIGPGLGAVLPHIAAQIVQGAVQRRHDGNSYRYETYHQSTDGGHDGHDDSAVRQWRLRRRGVVGLIHSKIVPAQVPRWQGGASRIHRNDLAGATALRQSRWRWRRTPRRPPAPEWRCRWPAVAILLRRRDSGPAMRVTVIEGRQHSHSRASAGSCAPSSPTRCSPNGCRSATRSAGWADRCATAGHVTSAGRGLGGPHPARRRRASDGGGGPRRPHRATPPPRPHRHQRRCLRRPLPLTASSMRVNRPSS